MSTRLAGQILMCCIWKNVECPVLDSFLLLIIIILLLLWLLLFRDCGNGGWKMTRMTRMTRYRYDRVSPKPGRRVSSSCRLMTLWCLAAKSVGLLLYFLDQQRNLVILNIAAALRPNYFLHFTITHPFQLQRTFVFAPSTFFCTRHVNIFWHRAEPFGMKFGVKILR
jgi:hypothetical protein